MFKTNWNAPIPEQAAAIVVGKRGEYLARFPYEPAGGRDAAHRAAVAWRDKHAPNATVRGFTGRVRFVWEPDRG